MSDLNVQAITKLDSISFLHEWKIRDSNFLMKPALQNGLCSPILSHTDMYSIEYQITIKGNTEQKNRTNNYNYGSVVEVCNLQVGLLFHKNKAFDLPLSVYCKLTHMTDEYEAIMTSVIEGRIPLKSFSTEKTNMPSSITIVCTLTRHICITKPIMIKNREDLQIKLSKSTEELKNKELHSVVPKNEAKLNVFLFAMYENSEFSDMTIYVKGEPFYIHTVILSCYPYFENLILEAKSLGYEDIYIDDVEPYIFKQVLHHIYTGEDKDLQSVAIQSLPIIKKFGINTLYQHYVELLGKTLTINNVIDILNTAKEVNEPILLSNIKKFIQENIYFINKSEVYNELKHFYPDLLIQVLDNIMTT